MGNRQSHNVFGYGDIIFIQSYNKKIRLHRKILASRGRCENGVEGIIWIYRDESDKSMG